MYPKLRPILPYNELRLYFLYIILVEIGYSSKGIHNVVAFGEISSQINKIAHIVYDSWNVASFTRKMLIYPIRKTRNSLVLRKSANVIATSMRWLQNERITFLCLG